MTPEFAIWICKNTVYTALLVAAPALLAGLVVGLVVSLLQAVTQVHEMTLTFIPKILAVVVVMLLTLPWMLNTLVSFAQNIFSYIASGLV